MQVDLYSLADGARKAEGSVVVIDVYRAFTCTPLLFSHGVRKIMLIATPEEGFALKRRMPELILIGEVGGVPIEGFDLDNSPSEILRAGPKRFSGGTVALRTSSGVQGALIALERADEVLLGSFVLAGATAAYLTAKAPPRVCIVAMGQNMAKKVPEDEWCARYIAHLLGLVEYNHQEALREIVFHASTRQFLNDQRPYFPAEDPILCLQRDLFNFVLLAEKDGARVVVRKVDLWTSLAPDVEKR